MTQEFTHQQEYGPPNGKTGEMPLGLQVNSNWLNKGVYQIICSYHNLSDVSKAWFKLHSPPWLVPEWLFTNTHTHTIKEIQVQWNFKWPHYAISIQVKKPGQKMVQRISGFVESQSCSTSDNKKTTTKISRTTLQRADRVIILKRSSGKRNLKSGLVFIPYILTLVYSVQCFFFSFSKNQTMHALCYFLQMSG